MQQTGWMAGLAGGLVVAALASAAMADPAEIDRLCGPPGMKFGMSVEDWKALEFPGAGPGVIQPICSDQPLAAQFMGVGPTNAPGATLVCGYADRIGSVFQRAAITVLHSYSAQTLRYTFPARRLAEVDCQLEAGALDAARTHLNRVYGQPRAGHGGHQHWPIAGGQVTLEPPRGPDDMVTLRYVADEDQ